MNSAINLDQIVTSRLILRKVQHADQAAIFDIFSDIRSHRYNPAGPMKHPDAAMHLLANWQLHWSIHGVGIWSIALANDSDRIIGFGGLMWKSVNGAQRMCMALRLSPDRWRQGYGSEILSIVSQQAFTHLNVSEICSIVCADNIPARHLLESRKFGVIGKSSGAYGISNRLVYRLPNPASEFVEMLDAA